MRKIIVLSFVSLDGVMQAPGGKGEDPSGGFDMEGWTVPFFDEKLGEIMGAQMSQPFDLLLGRKTYDIFAAYWQTHEDNPFDDTVIKYVVSDGTVDTTWKTTVQLQGDAVKEIKQLKKQTGPDLQVHGSGELIQTLLKHDLVDELWLKIFPVTLGQGKRLFGEGIMPAAYKLTESVVSPRGVIVASYVRNGDLQTGSF